VLEDAVADVQMIERSISGKTLSALHVRLALRSCMKELRSVAAAAAASSEIDSAARESDLAG
jgi:hypothetical protein